MWKASTNFTSVVQYAYFKLNNNNSDDDNNKAALLIVN